MEKRNILILGVGNAQVDAIRYCTAQGFKVYALSYKFEGPGIPYADVFDVINIIDKDAVTSYCSRNKIDLIYSVGSDIAMPTVGYVAKQLNLPILVNETTAELLNNKVALRNHLNDHNISPLPFIEASSLQELSGWNDFPAILKPVDSQGQRGVYEINSKSDIDKYFKKSIIHSFRKKVILEAYIQGKEISVNAFMYKGSLKYCFISDRRVVEDLPGGIVKGHDFPTSMPKELQDRTLEMVRSSIKSVHIENGPVYFQIKYTETAVKIIEMTGRLDGCHIWRLIKMNYGIDLLDLTFKVLLDLPVTFEKPGEERNLKIDFPLQKPNTRFSNQNFSDLAQHSLFFESYYEDGDRIRAVNGHIEKTGIAIVKGR